MLGQSSLSCGGVPLYQSFCTGRAVEDSLARSSGCGSGGSGDNRQWSCHTSSGSSGPIMSLHGAVWLMWLRQACHLGNAWPQLRHAYRGRPEWTLTGLVVGLGVPIRVATSAAVGGAAGSEVGACGASCRGLGPRSWGLSSPSDSVGPHDSLSLSSRSSLSHTAHVPRVARQRYRQHGQLCPHRPK